jgi:predicted RNase H-like HicB family nuclease
MDEVLVKSMKLNLVAFKDDEAYYSYCPALELIGYGDNEEEAKKSFEIVLEEYINYTTENNTLIKDLEKHGWKITGNGKKISQPKFSELLQNNNNLSNIFNKYDFNKYSIPVKMQLA